MWITLLSKYSHKYAIIKALNISRSFHSGCGKIISYFCARWVCIIFRFLGIKIKVILSTIHNALDAA